MITVKVSAARPLPLARGLPIIISFDEKEAKEVTIADVKTSVAAKFPKFSPARQKLSLKGEKKALSDDIRLDNIGEGELFVKDLGPQISWRTVFLIEYAGPLLVHPLIYHFPRFWYGELVPHSTLQKVVYALVLLHFIKRELETMFVHRFSHGTMPVRNIFRNSAHYWLLSGVALALSVYSPTYNTYSAYMRGTVRSDIRFIGGCVILWLFAELSNLHTHLTVRSLRPEGSKKRQIPYGYGFSLVSYPNYFFETLSWVAIAAMTGSYTAWVFVVVAAYTMTIWAIKKHKAYRREFGKDYPQSRKAIFPFIL